MRSIPLVRSVAASPFLGFLTRLGAPVERLWCGAGLPARALHEPERLIPFRLGVRFVEQAARSQGIEHLGLLVTENLDARALGSFGAAIARSDSLHEALRITTEASTAYSSAVRFRVEQAGESARFCARFSGQGDAFRQSDLNSLALMTGLIRAAAGPGWRPREVHLQSSGPCDLSRVEVFSGARVRVGARATAVYFPRALLGRAMQWPTATQAASHSAAREPEPAPAIPRGFLGSVEMIVESLVETGESGVVTSADVAGMSVRTFQRRLAECGATHSRIVAEARLRLASRLLATADVKVIDISEVLGYSHPAHFTRAFRGWTSLSPVAYRRREREQRAGPCAGGHSTN